MYPNCPYIRTMPPVTIDPDPTTTPFPITANPNIGWVWSSWNDLDLRGWWFGRLSYDDSTSRCGLRHVNYPTLDTASKQWQDGSD